MKCPFNEDIDCPYVDSSGYNKTIDCQECEVFIDFGGVVAHGTEPC